MIKQTKTHKYCPRCSTMKIKTDFNKAKCRHDGLQSSCRECSHKLQKQWSKMPEGKEKILNYRKEHKDYFLNYGKIYRKQNRKILSKKELERMKTDENFRIRKLIRNIVYKAVNRIAKNKKHFSSIEQVGCSVDFFRDYIKQKFKPGMTWDNYGKWHIDHIIPCSSFDLTDPKQQKRCNHFSNLQPLWAYENLSKGNKIL
jgi:hypothetical protein